MPPAGGREPANLLIILTNVLLKGSTQNKSKALLKGKGGGLHDQMLGGITEAVSAQLVHDGPGVCLESVFPPGSFKKNTTEQFKAKAAQ